MFFRASSPEDSRNVLEAVTTLATVRPVSEFAHRACTSLHSLLNVDSVVLAIRDEGQLTITAAQCAIEPLPALRIDHQDRLGWRALRQKHPLSVTNWTFQDTDCRFIAGLNPGTVVSEITAYPLISGMNNLGVIYVAMAEPGRLGQQQSAVLEEFSERLAPLLNSHLHVGEADIADYTAVMLSDEMRETAIQLLFSIYLSTARLKGATSAASIERVARDISRDACQAMECLRQQTKESYPPALMQGINDIVAVAAAESCIDFDVVESGKEIVTSASTSEAAIHLVSEGISEAIQCASATSVLVTVKYAADSIQLSITNEVSSEQEGPCRAAEARFDAVQTRFKELNGRVTIFPKEHGGLVVRGTLPSGS